MGTPEQLAAGLERLAMYARRFGRDPSEIETIYRTHQFELTESAAGGNRLPFVGERGAVGLRHPQLPGYGSGLAGTGFPAADGGPGRDAG